MSLSQGQVQGSCTQKPIPQHLPLNRPRPNLDSLPAEILGQIASEVRPATELAELRLINRHVSKSFTYEWAKRTFEQVETDLSSKSLERLDIISTNPDFAVHVKHIKVAWHQSEEIDVDRGQVFGSRLRWRRDSSGGLVFPQPTAQRWEDVFARFTNCVSFSIERPFDSQGYADLDGEYWEPRGLLLMDLHMFMMNMFSSGRVVVEKYEVDWRTDKSGYDDAEPFDINAPGVNTAHLRNPSFAAAWGNIRSLDLHLGDVTPGGGQYIVELLNLAPKLESLTLDIEESEDGKEAAVILESLGSADCPFQLKSLRVEEARLAGSEDDLHMALARHRSTLTSMELVSIHLGADGIRSLFDFFFFYKLPVLSEFLLNNVQDWEEVGSSREPRLLIFPQLHTELSGHRLFEQNLDDHSYVDPCRMFYYFGPKGSEALTFLSREYHFGASGSV
ncbi:uncharacterized protein DSM5745_09493 [Aspergillus mulundensis]|uniref:Uncharacterized protein n=1 Tax=Aspergillus mulundensis TaxID=1810919 RepID=A0A3D8QW62_9EURO|nr:hypothetical protein DSM5745_09493 [Aspergillus mulundensis]RDW65754.1 hypothetical protein DSM5745_09493 [Aspergillus mulundensis]